MANRKIEFKLEFMLGSETLISEIATINLIGTAPDISPYLTLHINGSQYFVQDKDLELLGLNILKALNSKHLKSK